MNYRLEYPSARRRRGLASVWLAIIGEVLFGFFLLAGFGERSWAGAAFAVLSAAMFLFFLSGVSKARSGVGSVELTDHGLTVLRGNRRDALPWTKIDRVRFGGVFQPTLELHAGATKVIVYKALPGYPLVWSLLSQTRAAIKAPTGPVRVRCSRTQHGGALIAGVLLSLAAAAVVAAAGFSNGISPLLGGSLIVLFAAIAALGLWALLHGSCIYTLEEDGIRCCRWVRETKIPTADLREVTLEQARIRELATGYRYRGESMTSAVRYAPVELGLRVWIKHTGGKWVLDDTMTCYAPELLYDALRARYHLPGFLSMPELEG